MFDLAVAPSEYQIEADRPRHRYACCASCGWDAMAPQPGWTKRHAVTYCRACRANVCNLCVEEHAMFCAGIARRDDEKPKRETRDERQERLAKAKAAAALMGR